MLKRITTAFNGDSFWAMPQCCLRISMKQSGSGATFSPHRQRIPNLNDKWHWKKPSASTLSPAAKLPSTPLKISY